MMTVDSKVLEQTQFWSV